MEVAEVFFFCGGESHSGHFPLGGIFRGERNFLLFKEQLAGSRRQKAKEIIIPCGKYSVALWKTA